MRLGDLDALREDMVSGCRRIGEAMGVVLPTSAFVNIIDNAPTVEDRTSEVLSLQETIRKLTTAIEENTRPQGEWIPVSERLPSDRDWYLGVFREPDTGFIGVPYICDYAGIVTKWTTKEGWILRGFTDINYAKDYTRSLECVAWQPLPEPYKEADNE